MLKRLLPLFFLLILAAAGQQKTGPSASATVFVKALDSITAPAASAAVRNIGQTQHFITIMFPSAIATVSGIQVRIEASFDNSVWFPINADTTSAALVGGKVYAIAKAYAPWPYIRVRSVVAVSSPMTVYYTGSTIPGSGVIDQQADRFVL